MQLILSKSLLAMDAPVSTGRRRSFILYCALCVTIFSSCVHAHNHAHSHSKLPKAVQFREKWDATRLIRDADHIKEDLANLVDIRDAGEMTEEQVTFYFFRMHDFDDNSMLDGIELTSAMQHSMEHFLDSSQLGPQSFDNLISPLRVPTLHNRRRRGIFSNWKRRASLRCRPAAILLCGR
ncbi:longistatin isoform X1 [Rhipicephalus microplus]|uniref:longistatin isoform X1 n=1 Tax=Rhipicephalus microplus TaxID=6941 RepID=UPI003F6D0298